MNPVIFEGVQHFGNAIKIFQLNVNQTVIGMSDARYGSSFVDHVLVAVAAVKRLI